MAEIDQDNLTPVELLIWDVKGSPPKGGGIVALWSGFNDSENGDVIALPQLVERDAKALRAQYLAWVYDLGNVNINGKPLLDHLQLRAGFSYWWMTLIAEKCNFSKSPQITDVIKLMAFDKWASRRAIKSIRLVSSNLNLSECFKVLCAKKQIEFAWESTRPPVKKVPWLRRWYDILPYPAQALLWLVYYVFTRFPLLGVGVKEWTETSASLTFISYLFNLEPRAIEDKRFASRYWTILPGILKEEKCKTNWLHIFMKDGLIAEASKAKKVLEDFNKSEVDLQSHVPIDAFLNVGVIYQIFRDWCKLIRKSKSLEKIASQVESEGVPLWPFFREEWRQSMLGKKAMSNLWHLNLIEKAMSLLPKQKNGVYLQENMDWEFACIYAWKAFGHGTIIGCPHTTIRFWDLRHFFDARSYDRSMENALPLPDIVAVNGPQAFVKYTEGGYPEADLEPVEALRYLHLHEAINRDETPWDSEKPVKFLVLGDYDARNTAAQMELLQKAADKLTVKLEIIVKPHPACPISDADYPELKMSVTMEDVLSLLKRCDVAYTSSMTTAALDAYCLGVPVLSVMDPRDLNLSPLRGISGVYFVSSPDELAKALKTVASGHKSVSKGQKFFNINKDLPKWKNLLLDN